MKVRGTQKHVSVFEQDDFRVYIRSNIVRIDEDEEQGFHGWEYDEIEMTIPDYQAIVNSKLDSLISDDLDNKEALTEIYEKLN